jgi:hypothetical protein
MPIRQPMKIWRFSEGLFMGRYLVGYGKIYFIRPVARCCLHLRHGIMLRFDVPECEIE